MTSKRPAYPLRPGVLRMLLVCLLLFASGAASARAAEPTSDAVPTAAEPVAGNALPANDWLGTAMNAGAIAFCIWMVALLWRPGLGRSLMASRPNRRKRR